MRGHLDDQHRLHLILDRLFLAAFVEPVWFGEMAEIGRSWPETFTSDSRKEKTTFLWTKTRNR